jgi:hypothetical protein
VGQPASVSASVEGYSLFLAGAARGWDDTRMKNPDLRVSLADSRIPPDGPSITSAWIAFRNAPDTGRVIPSGPGGVVVWMSRPEGQFDVFWRILRHERPIRLRFTIHDDGTVTDFLLVTGRLAAPVELEDPSSHTWSELLGKR